MKPSVGRMVHYTNLGDRDGRFPPEVQAALITKVTRKDPDDPSHGDGSDPEEHYYNVSLHIFYEEGEFNMKGVSFTTAKGGTEDARGKWSWPERI